MDASLSDQEIDELDAFLESDATPQECMDITALDGFLTALAIGPGLLLPSRWMPVICGGTGKPVVGSAGQAHRIVSLIMRRMNMIGAMLGKEPPLRRRGGGRWDGVVAHDWCDGFLAGVELAFDDWQPLFGDQSDSAFLVPFVKLGTDEGRDEINEAQEPRAEYDKFMDLLVSCVVALRWILEAVLEEKSAATAQKALDRPRSLRPGRNDPCPCGSGRNFKKRSYGAGWHTPMSSRIPRQPGHLNNSGR